MYSTNPDCIRQTSAEKRPSFSFEGACHDERNNKSNAASGICCVQGMPRPGPLSKDYWGVTSKFGEDLHETVEGSGASEGASAPLVVLMYANMCRGTRDR